MNDSAPVKVDLREALETERMRLAACGVAALGNTRDAVAARIGPDNPYWSASYGAVCKAVDREMSFRERVTELEGENAKLRRA